MPKTWQEKYQTRQKPERKRLDKNFADLKAGTIMLISTPAEIEAEVRGIPAGTTLSMIDLRHVLAKKHQAEGTCPVTTAIFTRIASELALEQIASGKDISQVMPFWRLVDPDSDLAKKLSCGPDFIKEQRIAEKTAIKT